MEDISISFISVAFNSSQEIEKLINSINKVFFQLNIEIIIVDNSSCGITKDVCEKYKVIYIDSGKNIGFSKACNIGARISSKNFLFFINPDCEISALGQNLLNELEYYSRTIYIPKVKEIQFGENVVFKGMLFPLFSEYFKSKILGQKCFRWYRGSALIVSKASFLELNGWNEFFFMYAEDIDLFYRAKLLGFDVKNVDISLTHDGGISSNNIWSKMERQFKVDSSLKKFYSHHSLYFNGLVFYSFFILLISIKNFALYRFVSWYKVIFNFG